MKVVPTLRLPALILLYALYGSSETIYSDVQLVRVVDGDTVRLDLQIAPNLWYRNYSCRLLRVDAPELGTAEGAEVRRKLIVFLEGKKLMAAVKGKDRYGRFLIELEAAGQNVSDWLLRENLARRR